MSANLEWPRGPVRITGRLRANVGLTTGVPQIAADLVHRPTRQSSDQLRSAGNPALNQLLLAIRVNMPERRETHTDLLTPQNVSGPGTIPLTFLRQA